MKLTKPCFPIVAVVLFICSAALSQAQVTAIKAGKLADPETGVTLINQDRGGRSAVHLFCR